MAALLRDFRLRTLAPLGVAGFVVLVTACGAERTLASDDPAVLPPADTAAGPPVNLVSLVPIGSVQAAIEQDSPAADGSITFTVRVVANSVGVSAYQGVVSFAPGTLQLQAIGTPPGDGNEVFAVNPADFSNGRIRFAACSATTFSAAAIADGVVAFRFAVRAGSNISAANLGVSLTVVGTEAGAGLSAERLLPSAGILAASRAPQR